jgi:hypothetical protein
MATKSYIQPVCDVTVLQATYNILGASKPFEYGGGSPLDEDPV